MKDRHDPMGIGFSIPNAVATRLFVMDGSHPLVALAIPARLESDRISVIFITVPYRGSWEGVKAGPKPVGGTENLIKIT